MPLHDRLLISLVALALCGCALWLMAGLLASASGGATRGARAVRAAAIALGGIAIWWPGSFTAAGAVDASGVHAILPGLLAGLLAVVCTAAGRAATRRTLPLFAALLVVGLIVAYGQAIFATPRLFHARGNAWGPGVSAVLLTVLLIALAAPWKAGRRRLVVHVACAAMAATLLAWPAAGVEAPSGSTAHWVEPLLFAMTLAMGGLCLQRRDRDAVGADDLPEPGHGRRAAGATAAPTVDSLTQLPTRVYFEDRLAAAATRADASGQRLALLFIDLDGFKPVNDTYGHAIGDLVLEQVGQRLKGMSRGKDVVARVGGDEFLLLLTNVHGEEAVAGVATRLINGLSHPYAVEGREVMISCSVGIALYPDGCSHSKLIARADAAMYESKRAGGSSHCFYSPAMDADAEAQFNLTRDLRKAVAEKQFELHYQPKIDAKSGKVTAVEALLRWRHPQRGLLLPNEFIPIAERFGLINHLGNWVIDEACRQSRSWRDKGLRMRVAINLSAHQMRQDDIVERITGALQQHRIHPSLLTCEITESAAMEDTRTTQATFRRLGELGTHLSIDDFGTGYSSLAYLRKLPAEELKIDRSFIMDLEHSADARAVVDAVVKLAHALGLKVVAEGVENPRQKQVLEEMGCDELQGFLFAKPMSSRALLLWAINDRNAAAHFRASLFDETRQSERA